MALTHIAANLRRSADQQPGRSFRHPLPRGLVLSIQRQGDTLTLKAARVGVYPSAEECKIVAAVFRVPEAIVAQTFSRAQWDGLCWEWEEAIPPVPPVYRQIPLLDEAIR